MNSTEKNAPRQIGVPPVLPHTHCTACHSFDECDVKNRFGASLCIYCDFFLHNSAMVPLLNDAIIAAGRLATYTTPGGMPGDDKYEILERDASARVLLPIIGLASRIARRDGWPAMIALGYEEAGK